MLQSSCCYLIVLFHRIAYIDLIKKALELDQSELNGSYLTVDEATPREPRSGRFSNGGRGGGRGGFNKPNLAAPGTGY